MQLEDWNLDNNDKYYMLILFLVSLFSTLSMMNFSMNGRISNPDIALYLLSGLKYAGLDKFNIVYSGDLFYTPIISFISSLFFRGGYVDKNAIIIITSFISLCGYFGFYILLKNRFNSLLSLTGALIYLSLPIIIINATRGMLDVTANSIFIWILVFAIIAIDKNPKYFLIVFPLFVIGFFTKYIVGFALPLILLYYVMKRDVVSKFDCILTNKSIKTQIKSFIYSEEFKYLTISIILSFILAAIIAKTLILDYGGHLTFFEQSVNTFNGQDASNLLLDYNIDKSYYFDHFSQIIFESLSHNHILTGALYGMVLLGLIINFTKFVKWVKSNPVKKSLFKTKYFDKLLSFIIIALILFSLILFIIMPNHLVCNISLLIAFTLLYSKLNKYELNHENLALDLLFLAYFMINFIFISLFAIKVPRYALIFLPAVIYFVIWSLESIISYLNNKIDKFTFDKIPIIIIIVCILFTASFLHDPMSFDDSKDIYRDVYGHDFKNDLVDVCNFIVNENQNYHNYSFASDYHHSRLIRWYLNVNITVIDTNEPIDDFNLTDYIILKENRTLDNYDKIYHKGDYYVYQIK